MSRARKSSAPADASPVAHFEQSLDELEQLVQKMEKGEMSLDESLAAYERGVGLYRQCQGALEQAELQQCQQGQHRTEQARCGRRMLADLRGRLGDGQGGGEQALGHRPGSRSGASAC